MRLFAARFMVLLCIAWGGAAMAQAPAARLSGHLIDPLDNLIGSIDATVTVKNTATGQTFSAPITPKGDYSIAGLPAGTYDVDVPIPCCMYSRVDQKNVTLAAGQVLALDLHVGFGMNLGTIGDDPGALGADLRARTKHPNAKAPRLPDGKPDLSGVWVNILSPNFSRPPMKPWAADIAQKLQKINVQQAPFYCLPQSAVLTTVLFPYKFVQGSKEIVQIMEFVTPGHRQIFMDGRKHPDPNEWNPAWYGHSVGHWEKDTLVIDSTGFNEITTGFGVHSEKLHVVERIRRPTYGRLEIEITADDPEAWTGSYVQKITAGLAEGDEVQEWVCAENNKDPARYGSWKGRP
jgi:hypothetical protein